MDVVIGGEQRSLGEFSAYKAFKALEILGDVESAWREVLTGAAEFKRQYIGEHFVEMSRAEARRQLRPRVLERTRRVELEDGRIELVDEPVLGEGGEPLLSPDPLGHLTEADWEASGHVLRIPESPSEALQVAAMVPLAFRLAREAALDLMALALCSNSDLEEWDREGGDVVDAKLRDRGTDLRHRAKLDELVDLATATLALCREQVAGPFGRLAEEARTIFKPPASETEEDGKLPPPMSVVEEGDEDDSTQGSPTSSSPSPDDSDGRPTSSSTEPASDSSPSFASA